MEFRDHKYPLGDRMTHISQSYLPTLKDTYLVGGCVRDLFLNRTPTDFDLAVLKDPEGAARIISAHNHGHLIRLGKPDFILYRIILDHVTIDIQRVKGNTIEEDLNNRDFTINAMAIDTVSGEVIDIHSGRDDLKKGIVRMTSKGVFKMDPIRLIRAYRMAGVLEFDIDRPTLKAIRENAHRISVSAGERIREELLQMLRVEHAYPYLKEMAESDLLFTIFPVLSPLVGCGQNRFHKDDAWIHTLSTIQCMEYILENLNKLLPDTHHYLKKRLDDHTRSLLKLSALLHDTGKPPSKVIDDKGNTHFYGHEKIGADISQSVLRRLKFSNRDAGLIDHMIRRHLTPLHLFLSEKRHRLTTKGITRFFVKNGEMTPLILLHALADQMAKRENGYQGFHRFICKLLEDFFLRFKEVHSKPKLVTGNDLIAEFGLSPSPLFKKILNRIEEKRLAGEIVTKAEALTKVRQILHSDEILSGS